MEYLQEEGFTLMGFIVIILGLLLADLFLFNRKAHKVKLKEAFFWSAVWIGLGFLFGLYIYFDWGAEKASQYYTAFLIEKALSVDNLFVFIMVFRFFKVPDIYQHKVLFYGILGAIIMRAIFIFFGVTLIEYSYLPAFELAGQRVHINLVMTLFGAFLIYAGWKSWQPENEEEQKDFSNSMGTKIIHQLFRVSPDFHRDRFFVKINGKRWATQLLVVVAVVEFTDLLFAVDSIPAIFAVSNDPIILYTSNIFAILGLRALYFLLANAFDMFQYLKYSLAFILLFIGDGNVILFPYPIPDFLICSVFYFMILSVKRYRLQKASKN